MIFKDLPFSPEYLREDGNWVSLELYNTIMSRAIEVLNDPQAPYIMGLSTKKLASWGRMEYLERILGSILLGPIAAYRRIPRYNRLFNQTKEMDLIRPESTHCFIRAYFINGVNPVDDVYSDPFLQGIVASVPEIWDLAPASVRPVFFEYNVEELLQRSGQISPSRLLWQGNTLLLDGEELGVRVALISEGEKDGHPYYLGAYEERGEQVIPTDVAQAVLITADRPISKEFQLTPGAFYSAPYFLYDVSWQPISFVKKIWQIMRKSLDSKRAYLEGIETTLETVKHYVETLEDKVVERTEALNKSKLEAEYWRGKAEELLDAMLPEEIVTKMMQGKLVPQQSVGTVLYSDLAGFTEFSKSLDPAEVVTVLHSYFTEMSDIAAAHDGWINKFLGDGILIMFGLEREDTESAARSAVQAAIDMQKRMGKYPWTMRIGIATGPFITGEFGSNKLRRFDAIGHTMNLGSRLEKEAGEGEIMMCPQTYDAVHSLYKAKECAIAPKGIGTMCAYRITA